MTKRKRKIALKLHTLAHTQIKKSKASEPIAIVRILLSVEVVTYLATGFANHTLQLAPVMLELRQRMLDGFFVLYDTKK